MFHEHPITTAEALVIDASIEDAPACFICGGPVDDEGAMCYDCGREQYREDMADARRKYDE